MLIVASDRLQVRSPILVEILHVPPNSVVRRLRGGATGWQYWQVLSHRINRIGRAHCTVTNGKRVLLISVNHSVE